MPSLSYSKKNISNISTYAPFVDHNFITTDPSVIKKKLILIIFIFSLFL